eukprot:Skav228387  [mRNA]  locus=scaffold1981:431617:440886:+ [translate_table: standard]
MATATPERRINPYDKSPYTFEELKVHYKGRYVDEQVEDLWHNRMVPVLPKLLEQASPAQRADRDYVLKALQLRGPELRYATLELRKDKEVVLTAVKQARHPWHGITGPAMPEMLDEMWQNTSARSAILESLRRNPEPLRHCPKAIYADREIMLEAVCLRPKFLEILAPELLADRDFVLAAVKRNWEVLEFLPQHFASDREIVLVAVSQSNSALRLARSTRRSRLGAVLRAEGVAVMEAAFVVLEAVNQSGHALEFASESLRAERPVVLKAVQNNKGAMAFASKERPAEAPCGPCGVMESVARCDAPGISSWDLLLGSPPGVSSWGLPMSLPVRHSRCRTCVRMWKFCEQREGQRHLETS